MTIAIVLGNGTSRLSLDLNKCHRYAAIYGCNALYREYEPDVLIATDRPIATAIQQSGYSQLHAFYTRDPIDKLGAKIIPGKWRGWSSGPIAAAIAARDGNGRIYLAGFDLGGLNGRLNNVYADTEFYKSASSQATYAGNWVHQFTKVFQEFPDTKFVRVIGTITTPVTEFDRYKNYSTVSMDWFLDRINNDGEI